MRARTSCQNTAAPKTQTTSPTTPHFQRFSPKWSAIWAPHRLKSRPRRHQLVELHYTSLRHAARRLRVVQTPATAGVEGTGGAGGSRAWLRCPWAAAGPGRASRRRAERSSRRGRLADGPPPTGAQSSPAETTARRPLHPLGPLHPLRGATPDQKGCNAYGSGAAHPITRTNTESARRSPTHTRPRELALPGPSAFSDHQPAFNNRRSVVTNHRSAANSPSTIINRRSADTPRRAVAAIRDGNASGGQPVA